MKQNISILLKSVKNLKNLENLKDPKAFIKYSKNMQNVSL